MRIKKLYISLSHKTAKILFLVLLIINTGALMACGQKNVSSTADYIGIDAAKEAALKAANASAEQANLISAGLDSKNGTFYYQVVFQENGTEYEYDIDALTGVVIEEKHTPIQPEDLINTPIETKEAASQENNNSQQTTDSQMNTNSQQNVNSQTSIDSQKSAGSQQNTANGSMAASGINSDTAFSIALSHAGLTEADITFHQVKADMENGKRVLDVEFISSDGTEYDYELSAEDGTILSYDFDAEFQFRNAPAAGTGMISETQAKQTVLDRVPGASAENMVIYLDEDDGRMEYEGKLFYDNMEYEFKIDAYSGGLIEWDAESVFTP